MKPIKRGIKVWVLIWVWDSSEGQKGFSHCAKKHQLGVEVNNQQMIYILQPNNTSCLDTLVNTYLLRTEASVQKGKIVACAWKDNKVVMAMGINTQPLATGTVQRKQKDGTRIAVQRL